MRKNRSKTSSRRRNRRILQIESLEPKRLLAADVLDSQTEASIDDTTRLPAIYAEFEHLPGFAPDMGADGSLDTSLLSDELAAFLKTPGLDFGSQLPKDGGFDQFEKEHDPHGGSVGYDSPPGSGIPGDLPNIDKPDFKKGILEGHLGKKGTPHDPNPNQMNAGDIASMTQNLAMMGKPTGSANQSQALDGAPFPGGDTGGERPPQGQHGNQVPEDPNARPNYFPGGHDDYPSGKHGGGDVGSSGNNHGGTSASKDGGSSIPPLPPLPGQKSNDGSSSSQKSNSSIPPLPPMPKSNSSGGSSNNNSNQKNSSKSCAKNEVECDKSGSKGGAQSGKKSGSTNNVKDWMETSPGEKHNEKGYKSTGSNYLDSLIGQFEEMRDIIEQNRSTAPTKGSGKGVEGKAVPAAPKKIVSQRTLRTLVDGSDLVENTWSDGSKSHSILPNKTPRSPEDLNDGSDNLPAPGFGDLDLSGSAQPDIDPDMVDWYLSSFQEQSPIPKNLVSDPAGYDSAEPSRTPSLDAMPVNSAGPDPAAPETAD